MDKYENNFELRLYQDGNPQIIKEYIRGLCNMLNERNLDFHLDLHLDTMFQDEVYRGGEGLRSTYPYNEFEKAFDDMNAYFSFDTKSSTRSVTVSDDTLQTVDLQTDTNLYLDESDKNTDDEETNTCENLLSKIPEDMQSDLTFNLKIITDTSHIYNYGGITQLEYFLKNV